MPKEPQDDPTQPTTPKEGDPIEIPIPKRADVFHNLEKVARPERKLRRRRNGRPEQQG